jgi:hypothetical protein
MAMDDWMQISLDDSDDVLARFNDGKNEITIVTVNNEDQQQDYMIPSAIQMTDNSAIVLISLRGIEEIINNHLKIFENIAGHEDREGAAFASMMGMLMMVGVQKLKD